MTKSRRIVLLVTNLVTLAAGLVALLAFAGLIHQHSTYGFSGYASSHDIATTTDVDHLQTMGGVAAWNWERFTLVIGECRWLFLGLGTVLIVGSIIHFMLTPLRQKDDHVA